MEALGPGILGHQGWGDQRDTPHFRKGVTEAREVPNLTPISLVPAECSPLILKTAQ